MDKDIYRAIRFILVREYERTFRVIDGLNRQENGLTFHEWLETNSFEAFFETLPTK